MKAVRVILADDHTLVRAGIRSLLEELDNVEVLADCGDGREALRLIDEHRPDVAVLDIGMPELNGLEVARRAAQASPNTRIIILSMYADPSYVRQALKAGVSGYLIKGAAVSELSLAIEAVMRGERYLTPKVSQTVVEGFLRESDEQGEPVEDLTERQREILQLIAEGQSTRDIAQLLDVSVKTVETHRLRLMDRLGIRDVPGLVRFAIRAGLVSPDG
jgi:DNA-binding NarL/FixJ family response regulator